MNRSPKTKRYLLTMALALYLIGSLLAACDRSATPPTVQTPDNQVAAVTSFTPMPSPSPSVAMAISPTIAPTPPPWEPVFRFPSIEPLTLDPGLAADPASINMIVNLFEGLLEFDDAGKPQPLVAEKWSISPDGLTYTFSLRQGSRWSNGDPITAKDFEYAWKRNLDPSTGSELASNLYSIKGAEAFNTKKITDPNSVAVSAQDAQTLVVTLDKPAGNFLRLVATPIAFPLPSKVVDQHQHQWAEAHNIVSNGPFKVRNWNHGQELVLVRNEDYWGSKPPLQRIVVKIFPETDQLYTQELAAYENDQIDCTTQISTTDTPRVMANPKLSQELHVSDLSSTFFIVPNSGKKPFDDARVRRALAVAINPQKVIDATRNPARPADSLAPVGIMGRKPSAYEKRPDIARARQLLVEAGFPNGQGFPEFTYLYNTSNSHRAVAEYLQSVWTKDLGLSVRIENTEWMIFVDQRREANYDVVRGGWLSSFEDPSCWFNLLLDSSQAGEMFSPHWQSHEFDTLVRQALGEIDDARRADLYEKADEILAREMPIMPIYYNQSRALVKPYVEGYYRDRLDHVYFKHIKILDQNV